MSRSCWRALGLLLLTTSFWGCAQAPPPVLTGDEYRLRLVFDGLVTIARDQPGKPGEAWVLVGNATHPEHLEVGKHMPPHMSHLLVRVEDENHKKEATVSGRTLEPPALKPPVPKADLPGFWREIMLTGEDLSLANGTNPEGASLAETRTSEGLRTSTKFKLEFDRFFRKQPCNPSHWFFFCWKNRAMSQLRNMGWTADLDDALAKLPGNPQGNGFKKCLTEENYDCNERAHDKPLLLNARLKLNNAEISVHRFFGEKTRKDPDTPKFPGPLPRFRMKAASRNLSRTRAQADEIAADLILKGPVEIRSKRLDTGEELDPIIIQGEPGATVEVRLRNHTDACRTRRECEAIGFFDNDFKFNFNLLENPHLVGTNALPAPVQTTPEPPAFNSQCSPSSYRPDNG